MAFEHLDSLRVFMLVPFLDGFAKIRTNGFIPLFVLKFVGRKQLSTQLAAAINSAVVGARDRSRGRTDIFLSTI